MAISLLIKNKKRFLRVLFFTILLLPLWMLTAWYVSGKRKLAIAIVDKTVLTAGQHKHISLNWILNQEKFSKNEADLYQADKDYYGFFPLPDKEFEIKGLERLNNKQLEDLGNDADAAYITNAYGIYRNEWYKESDTKERSGIIYGGLSEQDLYFLKQMKANHKLIVTEFNCIGPPTTPGIRDKFEKSFGVSWTGWTGRYFNSLDTIVNPEIPKWLINNYKLRHNGQWPFTKAGIVFIHTDERLVILENGTQLLKEFPYIHASREGQVHYGLPLNINYLSWFDVVQPDTSYNHTISSFEIDANDKGKEELRNNNIPLSFPAITTHLNRDYRFFYFSANLCDNPVKMGSSYFKGIHYFEWFLYNTRDPLDRSNFFWTFYRPLIKTILNDYHSSLQQP